MKRPEEGTSNEALHRLHDGELGAEERARVEAQLGEEDRLRLQAIAELGEAVRNATAAPLEGFDAWAAVERQIAPARVLSITERLRRRRAPMWISTALAVAAAAAFLFLPRSPGAPSNNCDIESLDVTGGNATVMKLDDPHGGGTTTVVWLQEE
jgi:anti-sigma factor RsiW